MLARIAEHLAHYARRFADVLVDDGGRDNLEEVGLESCGDGTGEQRLSGSGGTIEQNTFGGLDADALEELGVEKRELDDLQCTTTGVNRETTPRAPFFRADAPRATRALAHRDHRYQRKRHLLDLPGSFCTP